MHIYIYIYIHSVCFMYLYNCFMLVSCVQFVYAYLLNLLPLGRHDLSNASCLIRPHSCYTCLFVSRLATI